MVSPHSQPPFSAPFLWPLLAVASASEATSEFLSELANSLVPKDQNAARAPEPGWATPNVVALELPTMRLRDFSTQTQGRAALLCAPYALHGATVADFAPGHSVVETLRGGGLARVFVTEWRSATPEMRYFSIDSYLADLNVAVDELRPPVDLVGLCQGGWMALVYAARFPQKVRRLVLVGAPVDIGAGESQLSRLAADTPLKIFEDLVRLGEGRIQGQRVLDLWGSTLVADDIDGLLQIAPKTDATRRRELEQRFRDWYAWTVDLPGTYYLQVVRWLFKQNRIAARGFVALGHRINLGDVRAPVFMLAARDDELVSSDQLFATARLIGTSASDVTMVTEPCRHLALFLGAETLAGSWRNIARWLCRDS